MRYNKGSTCTYYSLSLPYVHYVLCPLTSQRSWSLAERNRSRALICLNNANVFLMAAERCTLSSLCESIAVPYNIARNLFLYASNLNEQGLHKLEHRLNIPQTKAKN